MRTAGPQYRKPAFPGNRSVSSEQTTEQGALMSHSPAGGESRRIPVYPIIIAVILGVLVGHFFPHFGVKVKYAGLVFLNLLFVMVIPLIITSMIMGINGLGDIRHVGSIGLKTVGIYLITTFLATSTGLLLGVIANPGKGMVREANEFPEASYSIVQTPLSGGSILSFNGANLLLPSKINPQSQIVELTDQGAFGLIDPDSRIGKKEIPILKWQDETGKKVEPKLNGTGFRIKANPKKLTAGDILNSFVPRNIIRAMAEENVFPLILFSLAFGGILSTLGLAGKPLLDVINAVNITIIKAVELLMLVAPIGIFGLVAGSIADAELSTAGGFVAEFFRVARYGGAVMGGLLVHAWVSLALILWLVSRRNPFTFARNMIPQTLTAFSTSSSMATLPVSITLAVEKNKISERIANFVLPIGATVNMDGTALYQVVAAMFIAQSYGITLSLSQMLILVLTATIGSIGAAGIPSAGLITLVIVLRSVGLPVEGIGLILSIDWLLDRFRTAVNVWGDVVVASVIDRFEEGYEAEHPVRADMSEAVS